MGEALRAIEDAPPLYIKETNTNLTDMTKKFGDPGLIEHWLRNRDTIEFLGVWEQIHNQNFNTPEFGVIKKDAGANRFTMSALIVAGISLALLHSGALLAARRS